MGSYTLYQEGEYFGPYTRSDHRTGDRWLSTRPESPTGDDIFVGVAVIADGDVWGVGRSSRFTLTEHWDGSTWTVVPSPSGNPTPPARRDANLLLAATALPSDDVWTVGYSYESDSFTQHTLILHWDGT